MRCVGGACGRIDKSRHSSKTLFSWMLHDISHGFEYNTKPIALQYEQQRDSFYNITDIVNSYSWTAVMCSITSVSKCAREVFFFSSEQEQFLYLILQIYALSPHFSTISQWQKNKWARLHCTNQSAAHINISINISTVSLTVLLIGPGERVDPM